jgi:putative transposase
MQIKRLHKNFYKLWAYARTQICLDAYRKKYETQVSRWQKLKSEGVSDKTCQEIVGISRATYYRSKKIMENLNKGMKPPSKRPHKINKPHWGESEKQLVLKIRRENPTYGKQKIAIILKRDKNLHISESSVGRILTFLKEKGLVQKSLSAVRRKRKRGFQKGYARPWKFKEYNKMLMGENVQIDHMTVTKNGVSFKHFQAWDRRSKFIHAQLYSNAKSSSAKRFLLEFLEKAPFKVQSIQVDGGSEFMADFEDACRELKIPLFVLPPRKPIYNGGVERGNRIFREEFYANPNILADSISAFRNDLKNSLHKYNSYRPHYALKGLTPFAYIQSIQSGALS